MDLAPGRPFMKHARRIAYLPLDRRCWTGWSGSIVLKMILRGGGEKDGGGRDIGVIYGVVMGERTVVTWNLRDFFASIGGNHDI